MTDAQRADKLDRLLIKATDALFLAAAVLDDAERPKVSAELRDIGASIVEQMIDGDGA